MSMPGTRGRARPGFVALIAVVLALGWSTIQANDLTLEERIEIADVNGLAWLATQQLPNGAFSDWCDAVAYTALATLKFETRAIEMGMDPLSPEYEYAPVVELGLDFIVANAYPFDITSEPAADSNDNGIGVIFNACPDMINHEIYNTSTAIMALAASGHPELFGDLLQDAVDLIAFAQADEDCGVHRGGWRYVCDQCDTDNSNTGYVTLGLGYAAAAPPYGFSLTIPPFVLDELAIWVDTIQFRSLGDEDDGASWYAPGWWWPNILKNGNLMYEMALIGDALEADRVDAALGYIERHWTMTTDEGWRNHCQASFTMMKGFEAFGIETIEVGGIEVKWFPEVAEHLLAAQLPDGSWPSDPWGNQVLSTAWALLTIERAVPQVHLEAPMDIKPGSCPNPLNTGAKGVLPVAVLGSDVFDPSHIDPASILLNGEVAPLRWAMEDVATPYEPQFGFEDMMDCHTLTADGFMDMTIKFAMPEVMASLGDVQDGDVMTLELTGSMLEEFGGGPMVCYDVIVIRD